LCKRVSSIRLWQPITKPKEIDPTLATPAAWLVTVAADLVQEPPDAAIAGYLRASEIDTALEGVDASPLNTLCRHGSIAGRAADVLAACEQAVALAPDAGAIRDSRGLARALTGDTSGAIEDFQAFIDWTSNDDRIAQRQAWITALEAGRNPFDAETLEQLKSQ
jgi:hypothetical protein